MAPMRKRTCADRCRAPRLDEQRPLWLLGVRPAQPRARQPAVGVASDSGQEARDSGLGRPRLPGTGQSRRGPACPAEKPVTSSVC